MAGCLVGEKETAAATATATVKKNAWVLRRAQNNKREGFTNDRVPLLFLLLALVTSSFAPLVAQSPAPVEIVTLEQHLWTTMAEADFATVRSLFTKDFIEVDERIQAADALLINLKHCKLESYELRDLQVRILSPDSALTAYHVVNTFNCGTEDKPQRTHYDNNSTTVWVRQPGTTKWLVQAHTEAAAKP